MTRRGSPFDEMAGGIFVMFAAAILFAMWAAIGKGLFVMLKLTGWVTP